MMVVLYQFKSGNIAGMESKWIDQETMYRAWDRSLGEWVYYESR